MEIFGFPTVDADLVCSGKITVHEFGELFCGPRTMTVIAPIPRRGISRQHEFYVHEQTTDTSFDDDGNTIVKVNFIAWERP